MDSSFTPLFFAANRSALRKRLQSDAPIIIAANGLVQRTDDNAFPFQQDSNFWYLTGIDDPDLVLVMTSTSEYIVAPPSRSAIRQAFDGDPDVGAYAGRSGITQVISSRTGWNMLKTELRQRREAYVCGTAKRYDSQHGLWLNPATAQLHSKLKRLVPGIALLPLDNEMASLRVVKQPAELLALQTAIDITVATLGDIRRDFHSYTQEYEAEAAVSYGFRKRGASGHSFSPIIANGGRATILHNVANNGAIAQNELTVLDIGAEVSHYAADITRTIMGAKPTARQQAIYSAVLDVQSYALSLLGPDVLPREYERQVALRIGSHLQKLGLITHIDYDSIRRYYPHATSHFLGLDVHDAGDYSEPLRPNMVLTCEPGIYIPEEGIGVRIEDDILITKTGSRSLSKACPTTLVTVQ